MTELVGSIRETATNEVEVVFYVDNDDLPSAERAEELGCKSVVGPRITMSDTYNKCADVATGDILMECCDAVLFQTPGWDEMVEAEFAKCDDKILLVHGDDRIHGGSHAALPFLSRKWADTVGYFMPPYFSCDWCDTWVWEVAKSIGRVVYLGHVVTQHRHPAVGTAPMDKTHEERMARGGVDNVQGIWDRTADERVGDGNKLRAVMR